MIAENLRDLDTRPCFAATSVMSAGKTPKVTCRARESARPRLIHTVPARWLTQRISPVGDVATSAGQVRNLPFAAWFSLRALITACTGDLHAVLSNLAIVSASTLAGFCRSVWSLDSSG